MKCRDNVSTTSLRIYFNVCHNRAPIFVTFLLLRALGFVDKGEICGDIKHFLALAIVAGFLADFWFFFLDSYKTQIWVKVPYF